MSYRYGTSLVPGAYHYGRGGLGIAGALVPGAGTDGASALFYSLSLPADSAVEVRGFVTRWPTNGTLLIAEDGTFTYTGSTDYFDFQLYADGAVPATDIGYGAGVVRIFLNVGAGGSFSGTVALDDAAPGGTLAGGNPSAIGGGPTLDDVTSGGGFSIATESSFAGTVVLDDADVAGGFYGAAPNNLVVGKRIARSGRSTPTKLRALDVDEVDDIAFDFSRDLRGGDVLGGFTFTIAARVGTDTNPDALRVGAPAFVGTALVQRVQGGTVGVTYLLRAEATMSPSGRKAIAAAFLKIVRQA